MATCLKLVPDSESMRTHSLLQSSPLYQHIQKETNINIDVSLFLPRYPSVTPFQVFLGHRSLWRIPFIWEDDYEMLQKQPNWSLEPILEKTEGIRILNFHPIHIYLNSGNLESYQQLKKSTKSIQSVSKEEAEKFVSSGEGTRSLFLNLLDLLQEEGKSYCIVDLIK